MSENRRWINFGRYSSPPIGKGKILDCVVMEKRTDNPLSTQGGVVYQNDTKWCFV